MRFVPATVLAMVALSLSGAFSAPAVADDKTCEIAKRGKNESIRPDEAVICQGRSGPAGNIAVTCRFDQKSATDATSSIEFDSRNYKTDRTLKAGPKSGDTLKVHGVASVFFRGDTESGRDYQFIFKNVSEKTTPAVTVSCN